MSKENILKSIKTASQVIGKTWPLYSFVTSNPLSGYEELPFYDALTRAKELLKSKAFPDTSLFRQAWERGEIEREEVLDLLKKNELPKSPDFYLDFMESKKTKESLNKSHELDRIMAKWLAAFMDEGLAEWIMPGKEKGFYRAWRNLAPFDAELKIGGVNKIPKTSIEALSLVLADFSEEDHLKIFSHHLAALPGWTGFINYRTDSKSSWQQEYPISLADYLGARLVIAQHLKVEILPNNSNVESEGTIAGLQYLWLKAWENSWQNQLVKTLEKESISSSLSQKELSNPAAQFAFCIDTRSELIRRHVESKGDYETFGYAGFFGIAMDYLDQDDGVVRKSCPPIVSSTYKVVEKAQPKKEEEHLVYEQFNKQQKFEKYFLKRMKNMLPSAFGYVEGSGFYYALGLLARTLNPRILYDFKQKSKTSFESFCEPEIKTVNQKDDQTLAISLVEKVGIVKSTFDLTGWKNFAPLVLFVGHGSHSANNPFGSSLDCGACAASPGRHNARMLAKLANLSEVRKSLEEDFNLRIPSTTVFIGAEHNTTTDEIVIFDSAVPNSHKQQLKSLKSDLIRAQKTATQDRLGISKNSIKIAEKKANNWGDTRPEWGLAKNAGFIVAPRTITKDLNLDSRCFLHSYDWEQDVTGQALESIMKGPMVVTQWINNHYYFSTVDNEKFGGGSKITHNITGKFGVVQGNGGDLKMGLPLQSLNETDNKMYHQPLRLSVLIQAPIARLTDILARNENLKNLLDNEWIHLMAIDPLNENKIRRYEGNLNWEEVKGPKQINQKGLAQGLSINREEIAV